MAGKSGRKSRYDTEIKPHLEDIKKAVAAGATLKEIADAYGFAVGTLCRYKEQFSEFSEAIARGRKQVVIDIKAAMLKKALGFNYEEEKRVGKKDKNGENIILVEKYTRYCPPSEQAAGMLLRNYDPDWRDTDNTSVEIRRQEQDLRRAIAEANNFDLNLNTGEEKNAD